MEEPKTPEFDLNKEYDFEDTIRERDDFQAAAKEKGVDTSSELSSKVLTKLWEKTNHDKSKVTEEFIKSTFDEVAAGR